MHVHVCPFSFLPRAIVKFTPTHRHPPFPSPTLLSSQKMKGTHLSRNQRGYFFLSFFFQCWNIQPAAHCTTVTWIPPPLPRPRKRPISGVTLWEKHESWRFAGLAWHRSPPASVSALPTAQPALPSGLYPQTLPLDSSKPPSKPFTCRYQTSGQSTGIIEHSLTGRFWKKGGFREGGGGGRPRDVRIDSISTLPGLGFYGTCLLMMYRGARHGGFWRGDKIGKIKQWRINLCWLLLLFAQLWLQ